MRGLRWLLLPYWAADLFTTTKTCDRNPILGNVTLARKGLHVWRGRLAHALAARRRKRLAHLIPEADRKAFERDGIIVRPGFAPPELFEAMAAEIGALCAEAMETREGETTNRRIPLTTANLKKLPATRRLISSPEWQGLLRYVSSFDVEPSLYIQTIFTKAAKGKRDHQTQWHMDTFHPTMKAWLFLHDVDEATGPFAYAPGSHRRGPRRDAWERTMSLDAADPSTPSTGGSFRIGTDAIRRLGVREPVKLAVEANTLVVADTYGFHARGATSAPSVRIAIYASSRPNPFLPWCWFDWRRLGLPRAALAWMGDASLRDRRRGREDVRAVPDVTPSTPPAPWS